MAFIRNQNLPYIDEREFADLAERFSLSATYLRRLLMEARIPLAPMVEGVRQDTFPDLERTLLALLREYASSGPERRRKCRKLVITAKDHARLAWTREKEEGRQRKEEMVLWMLTWLENPGVFPYWVALRKRKVESPQPDRGPS